VSIPEGRSSRRSPRPLRGTGPESISSSSFIPVVGKRRTRLPPAVWTPPQPESGTQAGPLVVTRHSSHNIPVRSKAPPSISGRAGWPRNRCHKESCSMTVAVPPSNAAAPNAERLRRLSEAGRSAQDRPLHTTRSRHYALSFERRCITVAHRTHSCKGGCTNRGPFDVDFTGGGGELPSSKRSDSIQIIVS
jgi:hypothetical protein